MTTKQAAEALKRYCDNTHEVYDAINFAFRHATTAVNMAARRLAKANAEWHDDPEGDPEGYEWCHSPDDVQFPPEARAAVVMALLADCERIRKENLQNEVAQ